MKKVDLLIHNAAQLLTCASPDGPKRGQAMRDVGMMRASRSRVPTANVATNGALAIANGQIVAVGESSEVLATFTASELIDASGKTVIPGFVDCHTHVVYGGNRVHEFELRLQGASYMEIMAAGGGIVSTMRHTREASEAELIESARKRLDKMLSLGSTTVEIKTGYGLDTATELKMLRVIEQLDLSHPCTLIPTFLGAHTLPPEYKNNAAGYVELIISEMIPAVAAWYAHSHFSQQQIPLFIDVFCEDHAFDVAQTRRILEAGMAAGMQAKIHVDQFNRLGGLQMALDVGVTSADHLEVTTGNDIGRLAAKDTVAVLMPAVNFNLGLPNFADGRALLDAGAAVALATDMNPGSAPCFSLPLTMAIGCRYLHLLPSEALNASTINAAHAIGLANRVGSLEVGKSADLLIVDTDDYRNMTYLLGRNLVEAVIKSGKLIKKPDLFLTRTNT